MYSFSEPHSTFSRSYTTAEVFIVWNTEFILFNNISLDLFYLVDLDIALCFYLFLLSGRRPRGRKPPVRRFEVPNGLHIHKTRQQKWNAWMCVLHCKEVKLDIDFKICMARTLKITWLKSVIGITIGSLSINWY